MKKILIFASCAVAVAGIAFAQKPAPTPRELPCAVMPAIKVNIAKATKDRMFADFKGRRYFFCCAACPPEFRKNPEKYAKAPSIPTPKPR